MRPSLRWGAAVAALSSAALDELERNEEASLELAIERYQRSALARR